MARERFKNIEIRKLEERDLKYLPAIYKTVFGVDKDMAFWRWKYYANPAGAHIMAVGVEAQSGRVVGQVGAIPTWLMIDGQKVLGAQTCDIVILPEFQKGGPFFRLHDCATQLLSPAGVKIVFGYSIHKTLKISRRLLKFQSVFPVRRLVRVLDPGEFLRKKAAPAPLARVLGKVSGALMHMVHSTDVTLPEGFRISEIKRFDERFDRLLKSVSSRVKVMLYKDSAYLNWRYVDCPSVNYRVFAIEKGDVVVGFTVVAVLNEDMRRGYILELLSDPEIDVTGVLINRAVNYCYDEKADSVNSWLREDSHAWEVMRHKGFAVKETNHNLIVRWEREDAPPVDVTDAAMWDISIGDSDYV